MARVRPRSGVSRRCGRCGRRAPWYDRGAGRRRWRGLDWGTVQVFLEADAPRVNCPADGPTVVAVPWARHHAGHTYAFDDTVAWLAVACSKTAVCELMRVAWRTVGAIVARVWADAEKTVDRFAGLRRIGIDEISYKRHHKYLRWWLTTTAGWLVWAAPGRDTATLRRFFDALGVERAAQITHVSADAADWIGDVVTERCPAAIRCAESVSCGGLGHRGTGCRAAPGLERRAGAGAQPAQTRPRPPQQEQHAPARPGAGPPAQGRPVCAVEEPRRPHRPPNRQAGPSSPARRRYSEYLPLRATPKPKSPGRVPSITPGWRRSSLYGGVRRPPIPQAAGRYRQSSSSSSRRVSTSWRWQSASRVSARRRASCAWASSSSNGFVIVDLSLRRTTRPRLRF